MIDVKNAMEDVSKAFEDFKAANNERLAQVEKSVTATADGLVTDKVERINADLSKKLEDFQAAQAKQMEDLEGQVKLNATAAAKGADIDDQAVSKFNNVAGTKLDKAEFVQYKQELQNYMRKGVPISNAMRVSEDPAGGYWVDPNESGRMVELIYESSPMRQLASVTSISTDALEGPYDLQEAGAVGWVGETSSRTETATPEVGSWRIPVHEVYAMPKSTQKLLDDSSVNVEAFLRDKAADKFARTENAAFVLGDGAGKPRGFLDYSLQDGDITSTGYGTALQRVKTGANGAFNGTDPGDALIDLVFKIKPGYRQGANWVMNRSVEATIRKMQDGQGNYMWQPNFQNLTASSLLGFPIVTAEDMPDIAANSKSIAFGNFSRGYQIVDRQGIRLLRDPYTARPWVLFYMTRRTGGDVIDFDAIKILEFAA